MIIPIQIFRSKKIVKKCKVIIFSIYIQTNLWGNIIAEFSKSNGPPRQMFYSKFCLNKAWKEIELLINLFLMAFHQNFRDKGSFDWVFNGLEVRLSAPNRYFRIYSKYWLRVEYEKYPQEIPLSYSQFEAFKDTYWTSNLRIDSPCQGQFEYLFRRGKRKATKRANWIPNA